MIGSKLVFPGPYLDPESLLDDFVQREVTWTAGVPTIWLGMLQLLDANPGKWDLSQMKGMLVGGSAVPRSMIAGYKERHGLSVVQGWGMTETSPVASVTDFIGDLRSADQDTKFDYVAMAGMPLPLVELPRDGRAASELPWDGESMGELEVRGPWVASAYYDDEELKDRWSERRLVPDRRHRLDASARVHPDQGPLEGRDQVGRRVDLVGRAREQDHGPPGRRRGRGDRDPRREVVGAAARRRRRSSRASGDGGAAARAPARPVREVVGPRPVRVHRRDPEDRGRQVQEDRAARQFAVAAAEAPRKRPSRRESRPPPRDRRPRAARARRGATSPSPATGRCCCACARRGSTSPTCWSARGATRRARAADGARQRGRRRGRRAARDGAPARGRRRLRARRSRSTSRCSCRSRTARPSRRARRSC